MAYKEPLIKICDFPECRKPARFALKSHDGYLVGKYCAEHIDIEVREWNQMEGK